MVYDFRLENGMHRFGFRLNAIEEIEWARMNICFNRFCSPMTAINDKWESNMLPEPKRQKTSLFFLFIKWAEKIDRIHLFELNGHKFKLVATSCHSQTFIVLHISSCNKTYETLLYSDYYTAADWLPCLIPNNVQMKFFFFFCFSKTKIHTQSNALFKMPLHAHRTSHIV